MPTIYAAADMLLFPSYQENCPLTPLEAAACGIPVVFRDIEEYSFLYENYYMRADTTLEFINLTKRLFQDKSFYEQGRKISEKLIIQFDKNKVRDKLIQLYHALNNKRNQIFLNEFTENKYEKDYSMG